MGVAGASPAPGRKAGGSVSSRAQNSGQSSSKCDALLRPAGPGRRRQEPGTAPVKHGHCPVEQTFQRQTIN